MDKKITQVNRRYAEFEADTAACRREAACSRGCAYCCMDAQRFLQTYLAGELKPEEVMAFGKSHQIVINKMVV